MPHRGGRFRWGILGTGVIAGQFARQLARAEGATLQAVASRREERSREFAAGFGAAVAHGSYEALLADPEVDVVYVATPAETHRELCSAALEAGKATLCEKPFAMDAEEARAVARIAAERRVFCMEAMWMRFSPLVQRVRDRVRSGALGDVGFFSAEAGYRSSKHRLNGGNRGRGALLNFGVYGISLAHYLFGPPVSVQAGMVPHESGLDASFSAVLGYPAHLAAISGSVVATLTNEAVVAGSKERLRLTSPFLNPGALQAIRLGEPAAAPSGPGRVVQLVDGLPFGGLLQGSLVANMVRGRARLTPRPGGSNGLRLEAEEVMRCLAQGELESPVMPLAETVAVLETIDRIRAAWSR
jgi:predicted dehydrogenase